MMDGRLHDDKQPLVSEPAPELQDQPGGRWSEKTGQLWSKTPEQPGLSELPVHCGLTGQLPVLVCVTVRRCEQSVLSRCASS